MTHPVFQQPPGRQRNAKEEYKKDALKKSQKNLQRNPKKPSDINEIVLACFNVDHFRKSCDLIALMAPVHRHLTMQDCEKVLCRNSMASFIKERWHLRRDQLDPALGLSTSEHCSSSDKFLWASSEEGIRDAHLRGMQTMGSENGKCTSTYANKR